MAEIENLKIGNGGTLHIVGNEDIIANEWEAGQAYIKDRSYVIREHKLLMCNVTHTSVEPFDPDKWTEKNIGEALGTAGSANMIECTLAEYTAWKAGGQLINETVYIITDAPNLDETAQDISYDGGATTAYDEIEGLKTVSTTNVATTGYSSSGIDLIKAGKAVQFNITGVDTLPAGGWTQIATIPSGYRPKTSFRWDIKARSGQDIRFRIDDDGKVYLYNYGTAISSDWNTYVNTAYITA